MTAPASRALRALAVAACAWLGAAQAAAQPALTSDELFDGAELQQIWLHINSRDWQQLRATYRENTFYPCDFEWRGAIARNAGCRSRGLGSRNGIKPGLLVDFDHYVGGQRFLGLRSLVLDNLWQDPSMMRERLSMLVFAGAGIPAPRESHARLYVGSGRDYLGLYTVVEDINEEFLERTAGDAGAYLYECRAGTPYYFEDLGSDLEPYAEHFEPRTHATDSMFTLFAPIRDMIRAAAAAAPSDLEAALEPYLDLRGLLAYLAVENFLSEWDGVLGYAGVANFYLYRPSGSARLGLIPWDKDLAFFWLQMPPSHNMEENALGVKAWSVPVLRRIYLQSLLDVTASTEPWLEDEVAAEYAQIREAALEDPVKQVSNAEFEQAIDAIREFAAMRRAVVRGYVKELAPDLSGTSRFPHPAAPQR